MVFEGRSYEHFNIDKLRQGLNNKKYVRETFYHHHNLYFETLQNFKIGLGPTILDQTHICIYENIFLIFYALPEPY